MSFDPYQFRRSFPQLERTLGPNPLVYLDSAASTLKHAEVCDRVNVFNRFEAANVHRGAHLTSRQGTENYESAREKVAKFINAPLNQEIIFTRGTTEGINLIASSLEETLHKDDEILISPFEHHSNIVPWQRLCEKTGAKLKVAPLNTNKGVCPDEFIASFTNQTKVVSFLFYSNSFGNRLPVEKILAECQKRNVLSVVDGAQAMLTECIDVQALGCDFFVFSGHKVFAPYGIGVLYGRNSILDKMSPYQTGGSMIDRVTFEKTTYADVPQKFEAGTPNVSGAIGLGVAVDIIQKLSLHEAHQYVTELRSFLKTELQKIKTIKIYDFDADDFTGVLSFNFDKAHCSDVGTLIDKYGFAVRAGHHCTQPLMDLMSLPGTVRVSFAPYNTKEEIQNFVSTLKKVEAFFYD